MAETSWLFKYIGGGNHRLHYPLETDGISQINSEQPIEVRTYRDYLRLKTDPNNFAEIVEEKPKDEEPVIEEADEKAKKKEAK